MTLVQPQGWTRKWTASWRIAGGQVMCPVRDMASFPLEGCEPVRGFSWRTGQRHRPGLEFMVSTGRHHGFESIAEQRLLRVLDFAGGVVNVISQPMRLRFATAEGSAEHIPDFLAISRDAMWLIDVRPAGRVDPPDRVRFAAAAEVALACGWQYVVVCGWRPRAWSSVEAFSSQRRPLNDPLEIGAQLMGVLAEGPLPFGQAAAATSCPPIGRALLLHLLWHRRIGMALSEPLADRTLLWRRTS